MKTVLEKSLNLGAIFTMEQIGAKVFADYVKKFGFGEATGIELSAESTGSINPLLKNKILPIDAATASFGQGVAVTPLQMVMSYAALANGGVLMKPYLVKEIIKSDGSKIVTAPQELRRVVSDEAARTVSAMLAEVVENGHSKLAGVPGYYVAGKTGTAQIPSPQGGYLESQYIHTFIGFAPVDKPRFVMLVKLDKPKGFQFAESSATPIFGDIADRRSRVLQDLQTEFHEFTKETENFVQKDLFPKDTSFATDFATGGGLAIVGTALAILTQGVVFDVTGGIITTIGVVFTGVTVMVKKQKIMQKYREQISQGKQALKEEIYLKLSTYIANLKNQIDANFKDFDLLMEMEQKQILELKNQYETIDRELEKILDELI